MIPVEVDGRQPASRLPQDKGLARRCHLPNQQDSPHAKRSQPSHAGVQYGKSEDAFRPRVTLERTPRII